MKLIDKLEAVHREIGEDLGYPPGSSFPFGEPEHSYWLYDDDRSRIYLFEHKHLFEKDKDLNSYVSWEVIDITIGETVAAVWFEALPDMILDNSKRLYN